MALTPLLADGSFIAMSRQRAGAESLSGRPELSAEQDLGRRFEQMLWAEMLTHTGLEKSFTLGGGQAASAFSRHIVEAIAADLASSHPLGFGGRINEIIGQADPARTAGEVP